jgi:hypothetical protein
MPIHANATVRGQLAVADDNCTHRYRHFSTDLFNITVKGHTSFAGYDAGIRIRPLAYTIKDKSQSI